MSADFENAKGITPIRRPICTRTARKYDLGSPPVRMRPVPGIGRYAKAYYDENGRKIPQRKA